MWSLVVVFSLLLSISQSLLLLPPDAPEITFSGRSLLHAGGRSFDWPGCRILFTLRGSSCSIGLDETQTNRYAIFVKTASDTNYTFHRQFTSAGTGGFYQLFSLSEPVEQQVMIVKTTEACGQNTGCSWGNFGTSTFVGLEVNTGATLLPAQLPWRHNRRLMFIGDSITAGWGNTGKPPDSTAQACTAAEDHAQAWGPLLSHQLQAEYHSIAWGGVGLTRGDDAETPQNRTMPELMTQTLANWPDSPKWNASEWTPSAVIVHLGTNDFCPKFPIKINISEFAVAYVKLLSHLVDEQPDGFQMFAACGPMGTKGDTEYPDQQDYFPCEDVLKQVAKAGARSGLLIHKLDFSGLFNQSGTVGGCHHPSIAGDAAMAGLALPVMQRVLGW